MEKKLLEKDNLLLIKEMHRQINAGVPLEKNTARTALILKNEKLIYTIINSFFFNHSDQEDLQMLSKVSLIKAIDTFNPNNGAQFSTYASKVIYSQIVREFQIQDYDKRKSSKYTISLETPIFQGENDDELTLEKSIISDDPSIEETIIKKEERKNIYKALSYLSPKEQIAVICIFGLYNLNSTSINLGINTLNIARQRLYVLKDNALQKLSLLLKPQNQLTYEEKIKLSEIKSHTYPIIKSKEDYLLFIKSTKNNQDINTFNLLKNLSTLEKNLDNLNPTTLSRLQYLNKSSIHIYNYVVETYKYRNGPYSKSDIVDLLRAVLINGVNSFKKQTSEKKLSQYIIKCLSECIENINNENYTKNLIKKVRTNVIVRNKLNTNSISLFNDMKVKIDNYKIQNNMSKIINLLGYLTPSERNAFITAYNLSSTNQSILKNKTISKTLLQSIEKMNLLLKPEINCTFEELTKKLKLKMIIKDIKKD